MYQQLKEAAAVLAAMPREALDKRVLGPEYPLVSRIQNYYIKQIMVKLERTTVMQQLKTSLQGTLSQFESIREFSSVRVVVDVDPM